MKVDKKSIERYNKLAFVQRRDHDNSKVKCDTINTVIVEDL